jgi:putative acetyltransferase
VDKPGTVYTDPTTDALFELFQCAGSRYWVAHQQGIIAGACGIYPTNGLPHGCVEIVKLYVCKEARSKGLGFELLRKSISSAKEFGYQQVYLETMPELTNALGLYERAGFRKINERLGNSGHFSCNIWMLNDLID